VDPVHAVSRELRSHPEMALHVMTGSALGHYLEARVVLVLALSVEPDMQNAEFAELEAELWTFLGAESTFNAAAILIESLIAALVGLSGPLALKTIDILRSLTGREEGSIAPLAKPNNVAPDYSIPRLSRLLDLGLFSEVFVFLGSAAAARVLPTQPLCIDASVACIVSRKGGVGKSTIALSLALAGRSSHPDDRVCLIDLDLTGPIWMDLLCPSGKDTSDRPARYLNRLINLEQSDRNFEFGQPVEADVLECVNEVPLPGTDGIVGLLSLADLPRTNRYIVQAIANNRGSFATFLAKVLTGVASKYSRIIIDNSPGFDPHAFLVLATVGRVMNGRGCPVVVSTPLLADIRGTLLELSDTRLLGLYRTPVWIINKASPEADQFFANSHSLYEIAEHLPAYREVLPSKPLIARALPEVPIARNTRPLPFDSSLVGASNLMEAGLIDSQRVRQFTESLFFRRFLPLAQEIWGESTQ